MPSAEARSTPFLPEGRLALLRDFHGLDAKLCHWLQRGPGRDLWYRGLIEGADKYLTNISGAHPPALTMRRIVVEALELDGAFRYLALNEIDDDCVKADTWSQLVLTCAGTILAIHDEAKSP